MVNLQKALLCPGFARQIDTLASSHIPCSDSSNLAVPRVRVYDFANIIIKWNHFVRYSIISFNFRLFNFGVITDYIVRTWSSRPTVWRHYCESARCLGRLFMQSPLSTILTCLVNICFGS